MYPSSAFATAPAATATAVCRALARSSASRASVSPYLSAPGRSAWPGQGDRPQALARRLALARPRAHAPLPVLVVAVADDECERRAQRPPVPEAGQDLDRVLLELLAWAATVALLAAHEVGIDRVPVEHEPGWQAAEDPHERRPVRLACRDQVEAHGTKPMALRIVPTGAGLPVQSSNDAAPWRTSAS